MTDYVVSAGQTLSGITLSGGFVPHVGFTGGNYVEDSATVQSGGTLLDTIDQMGATVVVGAGGIASNTGISGGSLNVAAGGTITGTGLGSYYLDIVSYSYAPYDTALDISGVAYNTTINGGNARIEAGGIANGIVVYEPDTVSSGYGTIGNPLDIIGSASALQVIGGFASVDGGSVSGATVSGSGTLEISGSVSSLSAESGSSVFLNSGNLTGVSVASGASLNVSGAGLVSAGPPQPTALGFGRVISDAGSLSNAGTIFVDRAYDLYSSGVTLVVGPSGSLLNTGTVSVAGGALGGPGAPVAGGALLVEGSFSNMGTVNIGSGGGMPPFETNFTAPSGTLEIVSGASFVNKGVVTTGANGTTTPEVISVLSGATFENDATLAVASSGGMSVAGTLMLDPGQSTTGVVQGSAGATLELTSGTGTLAGLGSTYAGFGTVQVDAGANWTLSGTTTLAANETINLQAGSTLTVTSDNLGNISLPGTINFDGIATAIIDLPYGAGPSANITGFLPNDGLFLAGVSFDSSNPPHVTGDDIDYSIFRGPNLNIQVGNAQGGNFAFSNTSNGLEIALEPAITALVAHPDKAGVLEVGSVVTFDLTPQVALTADTTGGLPTLSLNNGGTATYDQVASTSTNLVFRTTVAAGQNATDLKVTGLALGGGSLVDAIGTIVDGSTVAPLAGSDTGLIIDTTVAPPVTPTPPTTVTGGVTVIGGAGGTVFITPKAGSNSVTATATGNDTVISQGTDTIQAGGGTDVIYATGAAATVAGGTGSLTFEGATGNDLVVGGSGSNAIYGGSGSDTFFGGTGPSILVAGSGANTMLLAGVGNATLLGGLGKAVMMFGGPGVDSFTGSSGGSDIMVGGAGGNSFSLTSGDVAFGGPVKTDSFTAGNGTAMIITGGGGAQVNLGSGTLTSFEGSGAVNYNAGLGEGGTTDIVGFTVHDHITLTGGFTAQDASTAFTTATKGLFGTTLNLTDGTKITVFGVNLTATQVSAG